MDEAEHDVLAYMTFAAQHRTKLHSTQNRYMQIEGFAEPADQPADLKPLQITPKAA